MQQKQIGYNAFIIYNRPYKMVRTVDQFLVYVLSSHAEATFPLNTG